MTTFLDLKNEVLLLVIDTPTAVQQLVGTFVNRAIHELQRKYNFKIMEASASYTTTIATRSIGALPSDWKAPRGEPFVLRQLGPGYQLDWGTDPDSWVTEFGTDSSLDKGAPRLLVRNTSDELDIYPFPDGQSDYSGGEYRIRVPYWKYLPAFASDSDTNWFADNATQWIVYQAVSEAFYANEDENRAQTWETRAMRKYKDVLLEDKQMRLAEIQTLTMSLGAVSPYRR